MCYCSFCTYIETETQSTYERWAETSSQVCVEFSPPLPTSAAFATRLMLPCPSDTFSVEASESYSTTGRVFHMDRHNWMEPACEEPAEVSEVNLCDTYGHEYCGSVELDEQNNIVSCSCWCHIRPVAHA